MLPIKTGVFFLFCAFASPSLRAADDLLFYAPFQEDLEAAESIGSPIPQQVKGNYAFENSARGPALQTGEIDSYLLYDAADNIRGEKGTISMWVQPEWIPSDGKFHQFWAFFGNGVFLLYKAGGRDNKLHFLVSGPNVSRAQHTAASTPLEDWVPGEPHHLAATWDAGTIRLYVDGDLYATQDDLPDGLPELRQGGNVFFVGDYYHEGFGIQSGLSGEADTLIRDFRLYGNALTPEAIAKLATEGAQ